MRARVRVTRRSTDSGVEEWIRTIEAPGPAMDAVGRVIEDHVRERFATHTDPWGEPWIPPTAATVEIRRKRGGAGKGLASAAFFRVVDDGRRVVVGLASTIARIRHFGAPNNRLFGREPKPIPARPELPLRGGRVAPSPELRVELMEAFRKAIGRALR